MLAFRQDGPLVTAETGAGAITWDARRGGQMTRFAVKSGQGSRELIREGVWPAFEMEAEGRRLRLADAAAGLEVVFRGADEAEFVARAKVGGADVEMRYEVFAEGAVFCEMRIAAPATASCSNSWCIACGRRSNRTRVHRATCRPPPSPATN